MKKLLSIAITVAALQTHAQTYTYQTLQSIRPNIPVHQLTDQERATTTAQAALVSEKLYSHQSTKLEHLGIDVAAKSASFREVSPTLSNADYFDQLADVFLYNRDKHTNYSAPLNTVCYRNFLPFTVDRIEGDKLVISALRLDQPVASLSPGIEKLSLGDELIQYQNMNALDAVQAKAPLGIGANPDAWFNGGITYLSWYPASKPTPPEDFVDVVFQKASGDKVSVRFPWITRIDQGCLAPTAHALPLETFPKAKARKVFLQGMNEELREFKEVFKNAKRADQVGDLIPTEEPEISYKIIDNDHGKFGYLRLNSFAPTKLSDDDSVNIVEGLLINQFRATDGLIIDLKSNPGGNIVFADKLAQLFLAQDKELIQFRMRADAETKFFFENQKPESYSSGLYMLKDVNDAMAAGQEYTTTFPIGNAKSVHHWGTAYLKPVVLLTNSNCYSSCDMFSATLQDYGRVTVLGVDHSTGGGGANVLTSTDMYNSLKVGQSGPFNLLPYGQEMRVALRETIRGINYQGKILEDIGVESDKVLRSTLNDILAKDADRIEKITQFISELAKTDTHIYFTNTEDTLNLQSPQADLGFDLGAIDHLDLYQNSTLIKSLDVSGASTASISLADSTFQSSVSSGLFTVLAFQKQNGTNVQIAQLKKSYRLLPSIAAIPLAISDNASAQSLTKIYNFDGKPEDGWNFKDTAFQIGNGTDNYQSGIHSEFAVRVLAKSATHLTFSASVDSEENFDFFQVLALVDGKYVALTDLLSGKVAEKAFDIDLSPFDAKDTVLIFRFTSDDNVESKGVVVKNISIK